MTGPTWPKGPTTWIAGRVLFVSIPFTWNLPAVRESLSRPNLLWERAIVGGPAVDLMPVFFAGLGHVTVGNDLPGVLQRVPPLATRTTTGCPNQCGFCAIGRGLVEPGGFRELEDWPDLPIITDNNLFAASPTHFDRVMDRLERWGWCDFNQGVDCRLLSEHHAERIARIKRPVVRLALDNMRQADAWEIAQGRLLRAGVPQSAIRSYALVGFDAGPDEAWCRCQWVEGHGVKALPMWFHRLDSLERNAVTPMQEALGWTNEERMRLMQWFYKHRDRDARVKVAA
ncbi:MAG: hypothetical protein AB7D37_04425 [Desulfovibrio sp.]